MLTKSILLIATACLGSLATAATCYRANVDQNSVMGLKGPAQLTFLTPERSEGFIKIRGAGVDAETVVDFIPGGQPVQYLLEGDAGSFTRGSQDGVTTLNVRDGALAVRPDGEGTHSVFVKRGDRKMIIPPQVYRLETMTETQCRAAFPNPGR